MVVGAASRGSEGRAQGSECAVRGGAHVRGRVDCGRGKGWGISKYEGTDSEAERCGGAGRMHGPK
eukprot:40835-Rhodomonas_salina.1